MRFRHLWILCQGACFLCKCLYTRMDETDIGEDG